MGIKQRTSLAGAAALALSAASGIERPART
jgi:hypothetical protein